MSLLSRLEAVNLLFDIVAMDTHSYVLTVVWGDVFIVVGWFTPDVWCMNESNCLFLLDCVFELIRILYLVIYI